MSQNDIVSRFDRDELIRSLINGSFEEILLIDCKTGKVNNVLEIVFGREKKMRKYDGDTYDEQVVKTVKDSLMETEQTAVERTILLPTVKKNLEKSDRYSVDITLASGDGERVVCKEFSYRYLGPDREVILMECSDVTDAAFGKISKESRELLEDFKDAIDAEQFDIWFQPQFNFESKDVIGAEALVRWDHPKRGVIPPIDFIPLFESTGCIGILDEYVFDRVCRYVAKWRRDGICKDNVHISVNLSRNNVFFDGLCDALNNITEKNGLPHSAIHIEITESSYIDDGDRLIRAVSDLRKAGFKVEMDDFGSGYSSLNLLKDINIDKLKLDMRFLDSSENSEKGKTILSSVINMAKRLDLSVIAEGVETLEQAEMLCDFGCSQMQGYYFSRPMSAHKFEAFLKAGMQKTE